jgi:hypothetical protein
MRGPEILRRNPGFTLLEVGDACQPSANMIVPEAARTFFDVGLKVKNGFAIFRVPLACHVRQVAKQVEIISGHQTRNYIITQAGIKLAVAREVTAIEERDVEFQVISIKPATLRQRVYAMANAEPEVPKLSQDGRHGLTPGRLLPAAFGEEKQVNIRMWKKLPATIAT